MVARLPGESRNGKTAMKPLRVLLVDDHEGFLDSAERFLRTLDWVEVVGTGRDGLEAIDKTRELRPDLLLMDMSMPEMGGLEALQHIKALPDPPYVAIVSHYDDAEHREQVMQAKADAFISKLWYVNEVVPVLRRAAALVDAE